MSNELKASFQPLLFSPIQFPITLHYDRLSDNYNVLTHYHEEIEVLYFKVGCANAFCNQASFSCKAGDILFINSYSFHSLDRIKENCEYYCFSIGINILKSLNATPDSFPAYTVTTDSSIEYALNAIIKEDHERSHYYQFIMEMQLTAALTYILRNTKASENNTKSQTQLNQYNKVRVAIEYIHKNLDKKILLSDLCKITQLGPSQFSNIFKLYTGKTFVDYTNLVRCQCARTLFLTGKYSVTECAEMAGYNNLPYFARKYRQIFGETLSHMQPEKQDLKGLLR